LNTRRIKIWYLVHKWASLVCTLFMLLLCVTGLSLVFAHEIDHLLGYSVDPPLVADESAEAGVDAIVAYAAARRPDDAVQFLVADPDEPEFWFVRLGEDIKDFEASAFYTYDARTGDFLSAYPLNEGFMNVMLRLHIDMYAGLPGTLFLGFMGLLLFASLVSGTVLYGPFMRKLAFGTVRNERTSSPKPFRLENACAARSLQRGGTDECTARRRYGRLAVMDRAGRAGGRLPVVRRFAPAVGEDAISSPPPSSIRRIG